MIFVCVCNLWAFVDDIAHVVNWLFILTKFCPYKSTNVDVVEVFSPLTQLKHHIYMQNVIIIKNRALSETFFIIHVNKHSQ